MGPQVMDSTWSVLCFLSMIALTSRAGASSVGASGDGQDVPCWLSGGAEESACDDELEVVGW